MSCRIGAAGCAETARCRLVLAEDDRDLRSHLAGALRARGHEVLEARNGWELVRQLRRAGFAGARRPMLDVAIVDYHLPGISGLQVLESLALAGAAHRVVLISGFASADLVEWSLRIGAAAVLSKPFTVPELLSAVSRAADPRHVAHRAQVNA